MTILKTLVLRLAWIDLTFIIIAENIKLTDIKFNETQIRVN